ncbi:MAG: hypothetical protein ACRD2U_06945 [Terriglobales bacterium]
MPRFYSSGSANYIGVVDIASAAAWNIDKLGLRKVNVDLDDGEDWRPVGLLERRLQIVPRPSRATDR